MKVVLPEPVIPITAIRISSGLRRRVSRRQTVVSEYCYVLKHWKLLDRRFIPAVCVCHRRARRLPHDHEYSGRDTQKSALRVPALIFAKESQNPVVSLKLIAIKCRS